ncbi:hypothetical protein F4781DRAFT_24065 [Annulohypoxylon bovei var. microspora]|nr:hypothetical protein F4781DRAFT_24065 [Annulohypoxylon bovei var. microspora]
MLCNLLLIFIYHCSSRRPQPSKPSVLAAACLCSARCARLAKTLRRPPAAVDWSIGQFRSGFHRLDGSRYGCQKSIRGQFSRLCLIILFETVLSHPLRDCA